MLEYLVAPLINHSATVSYARQLPHQNASVLATFARQFNYPDSSHVRSLEDKDRYGAYTFFCSNSCAAYLNTALDEIGGFPPVLFGEDTVCVAKLLHREHRIAYVAEAEVFHSHDYSLKEEFTRHFDMGLARQSVKALTEVAGTDHQRGKVFVRDLLKQLWQDHPLLIPYACLQILTKFCGYSIGKRATHAPLWFKKRLSSQKAYWKNKEG
jgi:rhamnosyltransferase